MTYQPHNQRNYLLSLGPDERIKQIYDLVYSRRDVIFQILQDKQDTEEVVDEVALRIEKALPKFKGESKITSWIYPIAVNSARNRWRYNKTRGAGRKISLSDNPKGYESQSPTTIQDFLQEERLGPREQAELNELQQAIMQGIQRLPQLYKEPLSLHVVFHLSYDQITKIMGLKMGTVKSRIARARNELRRTLADYL